MIAPGDCVRHPWCEQEVGVPVRSILAVLQMHQKGFADVVIPFY